MSAPETPAEWVEWLDTLEEWARELATEAEEYEDVVRVKTFGSTDALPALMRIRAAAKDVNVATKELLAQAKRDLGEEDDS